MQRCYIKYATGPGGSKWNNQIDNEQKVHYEVLERLRKGQNVSNITQDPLLSVEPDYVVDYSNMPGFQSHVSVNDDKMKVQPSEKSVEYVQKMLAKGRKAK